VGAHAEYRSSVPANGATIATPPAQIVITFSQETSATKSNGAVTDATGTVVSTGWSVDLNERTKMTIGLKPSLPNGIYTVNYTSLSEDGHQLDGSFIFTIDPAAANTASSVTAGGGGGAPWGLWLAIFSATTVLVVVGLFVALRARRDDSSELAPAGAGPAGEATTDVVNAPDDETN
jgi:methionine-rich copper-binding protein CopC